MGVSNLVKHRRRSSRRMWKDEYEYKQSWEDVILDEVMKITCDVEYGRVHRMEGRGAYMVLYCKFGLYV